MWCVYFVFFYKIMPIYDVVRWKNANFSGRGVRSGEERSPASGAASTPASDAASTPASGAASGAASPFIEL